MILLSNLKFHLDNFFCFIIKILLENDYPLKFIFDSINKELKNIINFKRKKWDNDNIESAGPSWFTIPYIPMFSEKFNRLNSEDIRISFYNVNKLREFIKIHKIPFRMKRNLTMVYKICCKDCELRGTNRKLNS